jgi:hypothetical protein
LKANGNGQSRAADWNISDIYWRINRIDTSLRLREHLLDLLVVVEWGWGLLPKWIVEIVHFFIPPLFLPTISSKHK